MWIEKTKTGLRLCDRVKINGKTRRISVPLEKDTAQARRKATEALNDKIGTICRPMNKTPLETAIDDYITTKDCRESSRTVVGNALKQVAAILGPDTPISDITTGLIKREFTKSTKRPKTKTRLLGLFKTFLRWCVECEYINSVPLIPRFKDNTPQKKSEEKYLEANELKAVLAQMSGMTYYITSFLALSGCRIGETAELTMDDIDDYVHIREGKTDSSVRDIFIQPELKELLTEYKKWRALFLMSHGIRTDRLFFARNGNNFSKTSYREILSKIESPKKIHPHIFRHTHTALMAEGGMSLEAISRRLGHADCKITREVYYHVTEKQKKKDEELLSNIRIL